MKITERDIINEINKSNFIDKKDSKELSNNKEELKENENIIIKSIKIKYLKIYFPLKYMQNEYYLLNLINVLILTKFLL